MEAEITVTDEMLESGLRILSKATFADDLEDIVSDIYIAMELARRNSGKGFSLRDQALQIDKS